MTRSSDCFKKHWIHRAIVSDIRRLCSDYRANDFKESVLDVVEDQSTALALLFLPEEVVFERGLMGT